MVAVYAIATILGVLGLIGWVTLGLVSTAVAGKEALDPETRFGQTGRTVVAAVAGFGLAGMSSSYAGWGVVLSLVAAVVGATVLVVVSRYLGVDEEPGGDAV